MQILADTGVWFQIRAQAATAKKDRGCSRRQQHPPLSLSDIEHGDCSQVAVWQVTLSRTSGNSFNDLTRSSISTRARFVLADFA